MPNRAVNIHTLQYTSLVQANCKLTRSHEYDYFFELSKDPLSCYSNTSPVLSYVAFHYDLFVTCNSCILQDEGKARDLGCTLH